MKTEFECRFLNISLDDMRAKLDAAGFVCVQPETMQRRAIFDLPDGDGYARWLRLRDEGVQTTLTLKTKGHGAKNIDSLREIETLVGNFEDMRQILMAAGLPHYPIEENKREKWTRGPLEVCLDTWPGLAPFAEIESDSEDAVQNCAAELGFDWADAEFGNVAEVYAKVMGLSLADFQHCCNFANPPKSKK